MKTQVKYLPVSCNMSIALRKEHRLMILKNASTTAIRVAWKALLYAFILTVANVII